MSTRLRDQTLALAGIFQATQLVKQVALTGKVSAESMQPSLQSIYRIDVNQAEEVFGSLPALKIGLQSLIEHFGVQPANQQSQPRDLNVTKYVAGILMLERRLMKNPEMLHTLSEGIERSRKQVEHFSLTHENTLAGLADLYLNTISTLKPRIMIQGEPIHLANDLTANRIRALLLAAIRAAVLWRQCGGNRWQLFFSRGKIVNQAELLLHEIQSETA